MKPDLYIPAKSGRSRNYRHGHKWAGGASPEYISWRGMNARCKNKGDPNYVKYGGRGIKVCDRWRASFINFLEDMGLKPEPSMSIERKDNDGDYEPSNCRWATTQEQANNRRSSVFIELNGKRQTVAEWSRETGISQQVLHARLKVHGWPLERALTEPVRKS